MNERLDHFMARANAAYYATRDPFADFTTAPEISQVFGELLGLWAAVTWRSLGAPTPVLLAETGPGRGTLMADALRAIGQAAPDFRAAASIHLIETSDRLREIQRTRVPEAIWHGAIDAVPDGPMILIGNEFLDALPIRQFVRRGTVWTERFVGPDGFVEAASDFAAAIDAVEGAIVERREAAEAIAATIAGRFARHEGAALFLDYGPEASAVGDSLQAIAHGAAGGSTRAGGDGGSDRACRFRTVWRGGEEGGSQRSRADPSRTVPGPAWVVSADQPTGAAPSTQSGVSDDGRRSPCGRAGSDGTPVQGDRPAVARRRDTAGVRVIPANEDGDVPASQPSSSARPEDRPARDRYPAGSGGAFVQ